MGTCRPQAFNGSRGAGQDSRSGPTTRPPGPPAAIARVPPTVSSTGLNPAPAPREADPVTASRRPTGESGKGLDVQRRTAHWSHRACEPLPGPRPADPPTPHQTVDARSGRVPAPPGTGRPVAPAPWSTAVARDGPFHWFNHNSVQMRQHYNKIRRSHGRQSYIVDNRHDGSVPITKVGQIQFRSPLTSRLIIICQANRRRRWRAPPRSLVRTWPAGDGALSTCRTRSAWRITKSSSSLPSVLIACARMPIGPRERSFAVTAGRYRARARSRPPWTDRGSARVPDCPKVPGSEPPKTGNPSA